MAGRRRSLAALLAAAAALAACTSAPTPPAAPPSSPEAPEAASGWQARPTVRGLRQAVAAAHPLAAEAGRRILAEGGSAVDAAIAAQLMLALVEPQSSGIGGGGFLLVHAGGTLEAWDGRETAPAAANESLFLDPDGRPWPWRRAALSGRSVGVPGVVAMLEAVHRRHGALPWARLFDPAIALAEDGFPVSPRLHALLAVAPDLAADPFARGLFFQPDGRPWPVGHRLRNPELAQVFRLLARGGSGALAEGEVGAAIVAAVRRAPDPGGLDVADLKAYRALLREPLCFTHAAPRPVRLCGMPPPAAGHLVAGQVLGLLARRGAADLAPQDGRPGAAWVHLHAEAARLAAADRDAHVGDPAFVAAPAGRWSSLLDATYLDARAHRIGGRAAADAPAGHPTGQPIAHAPMPAQPEYGTTHLSVVDARGQAVALTSSIEAAWGSHRMVNRGRGLSGGFLLNNQLTDFSFVPRDGTGRPVANRAQPGKRPRSSMSPMLGFDAASASPWLVAGSPGGSLIPSYLVGTLWGVLHEGLDSATAVARPHSAAANGQVLLEAGRFPPAVAQDLRARGHRVTEAALTSGTHLLVHEAGGRWAGGADPRREGRVAGD